MSKSNITQVTSLLASLAEIEMIIFGCALPCAAYLELATEGGEIWQKLEDAAIAAREFLNNHSVVIQPIKGGDSNV